MSSYKSGEIADKNLKLQELNTNKNKTKKDTVDVNKGRRIPPTTKKNYTYRQKKKQSNKSRLSWDRKENKILKLKQGDIYLIDEITNGLMNECNIDKRKAENMILSSNFFELLELYPIQVHHDTPQSWVKTIKRQFYDV
jgi:outer membrane receptor for ferrienterochelin and colicin